MFREFDAATGLHAGVWEPTTPTADAGAGVPTVLAIHGITSSHRAWAPMARHADDVAALLDELGVDRCVVVGHSMGGYVAVTLAARHPERVAGLVLVDGGLPLKGDPSLDPEESLRRTLGPAAERLSRTFASREEYRSFWKVHPSFAEWSDDIEAYVDYDLVDDDGALHPATSYEAMAADSRDLVTPGNDAIRALRDLAIDATFLRAERGMVDEPGGLFPAAWVAEQVQRQPRVRVVEVPDVNHYTITLSDPGAVAVAGAVRDALAGARV